jgi:hypothetical protein
MDYIRDGLMKLIKRITRTKRRCQKARSSRRSMVFCASGCAVSELPGERKEKTWTFANRQASGSRLEIHHMRLGSLPL